MAKKTAKKKTKKRAKKTKQPPKPKDPEEFPDNARIEMGTKETILNVKGRQVLKRVPK